MPSVRITRTNRINLNEFSFLVRDIWEEPKEFQVDISNGGSKIDFFCKIALTKEFCAQPPRLVEPMYVTKMELEKDIEFRVTENLIGIKRFTSYYSNKDQI